MTKRAEQYLAALLTSNTRKEAAEKAGVSPRWLREIVKDPEFAAEYNRRKAEMVDDATRRLQRLSQKAITALESVLDDSEARRGEKISAAKTALEYGQRYTETSDILELLQKAEDLRDTMKG